MLTPRLHKDAKAHWGPDERALLRSARLAKGAVLLLLIPGLAWIGINSDTQGRYAAGSQYAETR